MGDEDEGRYNFNRHVPFSPSSYANLSSPASTSHRSVSSQGLTPRPITPPRQVRQVPRSPLLATHVVGYSRPSAASTSATRLQQQTMVAPFRAPPPGATDTLTECAICM